LSRAVAEYLDNTKAPNFKKQVLTTSASRPIMGDSAVVSADAIVVRVLKSSVFFDKVLVIF
jgi:hypothetical protein